MSAGAQEVASLYAKIGADVSGFTKGINDVKTKLGETSTHVQRASGLFDGLTGAIGKIGLGVFGITQVAGAMGGMVSGLLEDAIGAESIAKATDAVVASTKGVAGMSADAIADLASSLSLVAPFEDEAIQGAENMLLTFTSIGKDVFPDATEAVLNMSQALGQDLKSSSIQLGKALNDPIAGATALRRVGVALTDSQEALIKTFVESGDLMSAQKVILNELQTEFGGAARAAGETFAGKMTILQTQIGNVKEAIGGPLIEVLGKLMDKATPLIQQFGEFLPTAFKDVSDKIKPVREVLSEFFNAIQTKDLDGLYVALSKVIPPELAVKIYDVKDYLEKVYKTVKDLWTDALPNLQKAWEALGPALLFIKDRLGDLLGVIGNVTGFLLQHREALAGVAAIIMVAMVPSLIAWTAAQWALTTAQLAATVAFIAANAPLIAIAAGIGLVVAGAVLLVTHWDEVQAKTEEVWRAISNAVRSAVNGVIDSVNGMITAINGIKFQIPDWIPGIGGKSFSLTIPLIPKMALDYGNPVSPYDIGVRAAKKMTDAVNDGLNSVNASATGWSEKFPAPFEKGWGKVTNVFDKYIGHSIIPDILDGGLAEMAASLAGWGTTLEGVFQRGLDGMSDSLGKWVPGFVDNFAAIFNNELPAAVQEGVDAINSQLGGGLAGVNPGKLGNWLPGIINAIPGASEGGYSSGLGEPPQFGTPTVLITGNDIHLRDKTELAWFDAELSARAGQRINIAARYGATA